MKVKKVVIEPQDEFFEEIRTAIARHRQGENIELDYISINSMKDLNRILTPRRKQLLDAVKKLKPRSLHQLARVLGRDYKNVYRDATFLEKAGFLELRNEGRGLKPEVSYDEIEVVLKVG